MLEHDNMLEDNFLNLEHGNMLEDNLISSCEDKKYEIEVVEPQLKSTSNFIDGFIAQALGSTTNFLNQDFSWESNELISLQYSL